MKKNKFLTMFFVLLVFASVLAISINVSGKDVTYTVSWNTNDTKYPVKRYDDKDALDSSSDKSIICQTNYKGKLICFKKHYTVRNGLTFEENINVNPCGQTFGRQNFIEYDDNMESCSASDAALIDPDITIGKLEYVYQDVCPKECPILTTIDSTVDLICTYNKYISGVNKNPWSSLIKTTVYFSCGAEPIDIDVLEATGDAFPAVEIK